MDATRFYFNLEGFCSKDHAFASAALMDTDGWAGDPIKPNMHIPHITIYLWSIDKMNTTFNEKFRGLSVAEPSTGNVWIHRGNWESPPASFDGTLETYRKYVLQHEVGHCLGLGHMDPPTDPTKLCPVMYQQTKGTRGKCVPNWKRHC